MSIFHQKFKVKYHSTKDKKENDKTNRREIVLLQIDG